MQFIACLLGIKIMSKKKNIPVKKLLKELWKNHFWIFLYLVNKVWFMFAVFCLSLHNTQQKLENDNT